MNFRDKIIREASSFRENVIADVKDKASELAAFLNVSGEGEGPKVDENINDMIDGLVDMISKGTGGICDHIQSNSGFIEKMHAFIEEKNSEEQIIHLEVEKNLACIAILDMRMQTRLYNEVSKRKKEMLVTLGEFLTSIMDISAESNKAMTKKRWSFVSEMLKITEEKVTGLKEHESDENVGELIKSLIKDSVNSAKDQIDNYNLELDLFKKKYDEIYGKMSAQDSFNASTDLDEMKNSKDGIAPISVDVQIEKSGIEAGRLEAVTKLREEVLKAVYKYFSISADFLVILKTKTFRLITEFDAEVFKINQRVIKGYKSGEGMSNEAVKVVAKSTGEIVELFKSRSKVLEKVLCEDLMMLSVGR